MDLLENDKNMTQGPHKHEPLLKNENLRNFFSENPKNSENFGKFQKIPKIFKN